MGHHIPFESVTFRPVNEQAGDDDPNPVEFDLVPAGGADRARLRSIIEAAVGLNPRTGWSKEVQDAVIHAFETGAPVFVNTVTAVRNLTIAGPLAVARGVIRVNDGDVAPAKVAIRTGAEFARICGFVPSMAFHVAMKLAEITGQLEIDPRFFKQPSGSGGAATASRQPTTAGNVPPQSGDAGIAASATTTAAPQPAT